MGIYPLFHQYGDGHAHVNHHQALSGLIPRLITPCDLLGCNTDGETWLVPKLCSGFGRLKPQLGSLELACIHTYLFYDKGVGRPKQGMLHVGCWGLQHSGLWRNNQCSHHAQDIVLNFLGYEYDGVLGSHQHVVYQLFFIFYCLPCALTH